MTVILIAVWVLVAVLIAIDLVRVYRRSVAGIEEAVHVVDEVEAEREAVVRVIRERLAEAAARGES